MLIVQSLIFQDGGLLALGVNIFNMGVIPFPMTKIIATHDLELVRALCQRTVVMDEGKVVAYGDTEVILGDIPLLKCHGLAPANL